MDPRPPWSAVLAAAEARAQADGARARREPASALQGRRISGLRTDVRLSEADPRYDLRVAPGQWPSMIRW
ncbi:hypothetical protein SMICM304S_09742 [Streptomyces microflavus]